MARVTLAAPAKLNLHLGIYAQLDDRRYHRADSLMIALDLADKVTVEETSAGSGIQLTSDPEVNVPAHKNTAYRAAAAFAKSAHIAPDLRIHLEKHVPDQAGMGGSSSDAAAVLRALTKLWSIDPEDPRVAEAARQVGADVPFFLDPVPTLLVGAGDVVAQKFPPLAQPVSVALVRPAGPGVSTPAAYAAFDEQHDEPGDPSKLCQVLASGMATADQIAANLSNNLDPVACRLLPAVGEVRAWLQGQPDVLGAQVTGSGSCVFGVCADDEAAQRVIAAAHGRFASCWAHLAHIR